MISPEQLEFISAIFTAYSNRDAEAMIALCDPEVEAVAPISALPGRTYRGFDGIREWFNDLDESFDEIRLEFDLGSLQVSGDVIFGFGVLHLRGRESGLEMDLDTAGLIELRDGRILRYRAYFDRDQAQADFEKLEE